MRKFFSLLPLVAAVLLTACATPANPPPPLAPPVIEAMINQAPCYVGQPVTIGVVARGEGLTYQWNNYYGFPIANATQATYTFTPYTIDQSGRYRCDVSNAAGTVSDDVYVSIDYPPRPPGAPGGN